MVQLRKVVLEPHGGQRPKLAVVTLWLRQLPRFWPRLIIPETIQVKNGYFIQGQLQEWTEHPPLIFENLKPVEIIKKSFQHHLNILKIV